MNHTQKLPYARPTLVVYGDVLSLTRANLTMNMNDPGQSSTTMT